MKSFICIIAFIVVSWVANAQQINHKLAAVYVYNFAKQTEFPAEQQGSTMKIGIFQEKAVFEAFKAAIDKKPIFNKKIEIFLVENIEDIAKCNILYLPENQVKSIASVSEAALKSHTLVVSEGRGTSKKGAAISLFIDDNDNFKTKFELNVKEAEYKKLRFNSELLSYASK